MYKTEMYIKCKRLVESRYNIVLQHSTLLTLCNSGYVKINNIGKYDELSDSNNHVLLILKQYPDGISLIIKEINYYCDNPVRSEYEVNI